MTVRLAADLDLGDRRVQLRLEAGAAVAIDRRMVDALTGWGRGWWERRRHRIVLDGRALHHLPPALRVRRGLGMVVGAPVAADVTVLDHLAAQVGMRRAVALLASAPLLAGRGGDPAGVLSGGERRVLGWLRCIAAGPRAVVLDGAGAGLDPGTLAWCTEVVARWRADGVAVLVRPSRPEERRWTADDVVSP